MSGKPPLPPSTAGRSTPAAPARSAGAPPASKTKPTLAHPPPHVVATLKPPPQVIPLRPPPAHLYRHQGAPPPRKPRHRQHHRRRRSACSCRRACCLATGVFLLLLCLALAASCLAYLYYRPRAPAFHLQPLRPVRLRLSNASFPSAMDAAVGVKAVSWNPNDRVAFRYGAGEGRVSLADPDGDVDLGWAGVAAFEHAPRTVASVAFVATAKGVVLDEAVAARVRERYRRRQLAFRVAVDARVGVRVAGMRSAMVPVRLACDGGVMARRGGSESDGGSNLGPMSKCQVYLFRVRW
ncbi:hypothetical protein PR202_ga07107 [Eleusine coracana subsp. coracana]|uniref:Late embryogenesis abundant protein LEA-2 subgroup domain-containing protein n=1 Tax=Eleusine coracana subsp. coracana TaxID=191504 RepID=A0AAV5BWM5_ELECO|nr:hypothetical protein PR202_ga07107 [Eleusine coracana subsp. coracana]